MSERTFTLSCNPGRKGRVQTRNRLRAIRSSKLIRAASLNGIFIADKGRPKGIALQTSSQNKLRRASTFLTVTTRIRGSGIPTRVFIKFSPRLIRWRPILYWTIRVEADGYRITRAAGLFQDIGVVSTPPNPVWPPLEVSPRPQRGGRQNSNQRRFPPVLTSPVGWEGRKVVETCPTQDSTGYRLSQVPEEDLFPPLCVARNNEPP